MQRCFVSLLLCLAACGPVSPGDLAGEWRGRLSTYKGERLTWRSTPAPVVIHESGHIDLRRWLDSDAYEVMLPLQQREDGALVWTSDVAWKREPLPYCEGRTVVYEEGTVTLGDDGTTLTVGGQMKVSGCDDGDVTPLRFEFIGTRYQPPPAATP